MGKKRGANETMIVAEEVVISSAETTEILTDTEEDRPYEALLATIQEIRKDDDLLGYILRGESKAAVDLNEPAKIVEYAMMASEAFETSEKVSDSFGLGGIENIVIEGKAIKVLCLNLGQNKLSVFMKKTASHDWLLDKLSPIK
jgi:hypothetical protein